MSTKQLSHKLLTPREILETVKRECALKLECVAKKTEAG